MNIILETFAEICEMIGFFLLLGVIIITLKWCYDRIVEQINTNKRRKQIRNVKIQAEKRRQIRINDLMSYYELQSEDVAKKVKPNKELLKVCNWD